MGFGIFKVQEIEDLEPVESRSLKERPTRAFEPFWSFYRPSDDSRGSNTLNYSPCMLSLFSNFLLFMFIFSLNRVGVKMGFCN